MASSNKASLELERPSFSEPLPFLHELSQRRLDSATQARLKDSQRFHTTAAYPLRHLWRRLRLRRNGHEEHGEIHEHWIELFNDLIMVAMLSNLSHVFELGGRSVSSYGICVGLWCLAMQSIHFISYVVNLWCLDDLCLLLCCFFVTVGTVLMASSMKSEGHAPCVTAWHEGPRHTESFDVGLATSSAAQLVVLAQAAIFEPRARDHVAVQALGLASRLLVLWLVPGFLKYLIMALSCVAVYVCAWTYTSIISLTDLHHMRSRMDLMVLISLGEWVITTILREEQMSHVVSQTALDLMLAVEYLNTRQHGSAAQSARSPEALLQLESLELVLLQTIAICLFFLPATLAVAEHDDAHHHGNGCKMESGWSLFSLRMHTATILWLVRLQLLGLRHLRKCKVAELPLPGKKFYIRVALCFLHLALLFIVQQASGIFPSSKRLASLLSLHAGLVFVDVVAELSLHQLAVRRVHLIAQGVRRMGEGS